MQRMASMDFEIIGGTSDEFAAEIKDDVVRWGRVIRDAGIKPR
jgi:tripartite-type tricarboxylate transporter receptor subunit TctC